MRSRRIYINRRPVLGPWGGGSKFLNALIDELNKQGHCIVHTLQPEIDVLLCVDPRPAPWGDTINDILTYRYSNTNTQLVGRIGDLGTHDKLQLTRLLCGVVPYFDSIVYPSNWAREYMMSMLESTTLRSKEHTHVIHNAPLDVFFENRRSDVPCCVVPRIVTHHWSDNPKKGFCVYRELDMSDEFEFTYIGRKPDNVKFRRYMSSMNAIELACELPKYDIYLTASVLEAGANHVLEAMACGLPIVFSSAGGSIPEYVGDMGVKYEDWNVQSMFDALYRCRDSYSTRVNAVCAYDARIKNAVDSFVTVLVDA